MRRAAVVIVVRDARVLAVSRPEPPLRFGFPGGGVDHGESYEQAARRELLEETGLVADRLVRVHADTPTSAMVVAFVETGVPQGSLRDSPEGIVRWVDPAILTGPRGAFPSFARDALAKARYTLPPQP